METPQKLIVKTYVGVNVQKGGCVKKYLALNSLLRCLLNLIMQKVVLCFFSNLSGIPAFCNKSIIKKLDVVVYNFNIMRSVGNI